jgi:predicted amidohydrolase YtcJ
MSMNQPETLYFNANVFTMDREVPRAEALLVRNGRIAVLGPNDLVETQVGPATERVDLDGRTVVPGFNDCHCHILTFGLTLGQLDVGADAVRTIDDILRAVAERMRQLPDDVWIIGRGYDQNALEERRHPSRADLDTAGNSNPVVLWHTSGHALTCNTRALQLAGIRADTPTPPGGDIERDVHGEPTGVLKEMPATDLLNAAIPPPTVSQGTEAIIRAMQVMAGEGITSASDASTGQGPSISTALEMYGNALSSGRLVGRITLMPQIIYVAPPDSSEIHQPEEFQVGNRPDWLDIGPTKIFSDGALTTRTAALREPYADDETNTGLLIWDPKTLDGMIRRAHDAGWQIATHAIGDRAIEITVACYERALSKVPRPDHRHRIEHCMLLDRELALRIKRAGVVPVLQPAFIARLGDAYIDGLGIERASQVMPLELFDWNNIPLGCSSDRPVIPGEPLRGIRAALERVTPRGVRLGPQHTIGPLQAIRQYTSGSAFATHSEHRRGTLRLNMPADFTVLSENPAETPLEEFEKVQVVKTVVDGVEVYSR